MAAGCKVASSTALMLGGFSRGERSTQICRGAIWRQNLDSLEKINSGCCALDLLASAEQSRDAAWCHRPHLSQVDGEAGRKEAVREEIGTTYRRKEKGCPYSLAVITSAERVTIKRSLKARSLALELGHSSGHRSQVTGFHHYLLNAV